MPSFLSSIADKATSAINATPLASHLPSSHRPGSPDASQPSANQAAAMGGQKYHTLETLQHQLRTLGQQYSSSVSPVQKIITTEKGVAIDFDSVSRDAKAQSKELYTWGQSEDADLKDVTDRLAYLNFVSGSLATSLAVKLDSARVPFKALRDAENALTPKRNIRAGMQHQIARLEHDNVKGMEKKIHDLREQLKKTEMDDAPLEKEVELLKRKAVRESEQMKWEAIREYGEKLVLLSQASTPIIKALPTLPPTPSSPYTGAQATGAARASLQRALDNYKTGHINLTAMSTDSVASDLSRSDTRSFGESHASELHSMQSSEAGSLESFRPAIPLTPPASKRRDTDMAVESDESGAAAKPTATFSPKKSKDSTPIDPTTLNLSPTPIPASPPLSSSPPTAISGGAATTSPVPASADTGLPPITPTVAETGIPVSSATSGGPGPARGSLKEPRSSEYPTAEEEKKRLAEGYSTAYNERVHSPSTDQSQPSQSKYETAEEEKKRLEREERDRVLKGEGGARDQQHGQGDQGPDGPGRDEELPPYQDI